MEPVRCQIVLVPWLHIKLLKFKKKKKRKKRVFCNDLIFFTCYSGAEETRDKLRIQVYDAMAEKEKAGEGELKSEDGSGGADVIEESGAKSPVKDTSTSEEPVNGKEESSVQEVDVNGVEKSPVGGSPTGSPGKESVKADSKEEPGESKTESEEEDEGPEGSALLDIKHNGCGWVAHKRC